MQNPYPTQILDRRPEGHQSLSVIPRFMTGDYDRLQAHWKFTIDFTYGHERAQAGQLFWGLAAIEVKPGPTVMQPQVRKIDGSPYLDPPGILMFNHWPSAPMIDFPADPQYFDRAVVGFTEGNGSIGWGFGGESWINAEKPTSHSGGPYWVWCHSHPENFTPPEDRVVGSDALGKIGWWDDHIILNGVFQIMRKAGDIPPPSTGAAELVVIDEFGVEIGYMPLLPPGTQGPAGRIALRQNGIETGSAILRKRNE